MAGLIDDYIAALRRELDFDPTLAARLTDEVEAHLRDAAEADPAWPSPDAERRAVERFGLARDLAGQFADQAVSRQAARTWIALLATVAVTFVAMRLRVVWLGEVGDTLSLLAPIVDRYAFIAAMAVGLAGWLLGRRSLLPLAACLVALGASIAAGIFRAGLPVERVPVEVLLGTAGEIALMGVLAVQVVGLGRRLRRWSSLRRVA